MITTETEPYTVHAANLVVSYLASMPDQVIYCDATHGLVTYNCNPTSELPPEVARLYGNDGSGSIQYAVNEWLAAQPWFVDPELYTKVVACRLGSYDRVTGDMEIIVHRFGDFDSTAQIIP